MPYLCVEWPVATTHLNGARLDDLLACKVVLGEHGQGAPRRTHNLRIGRRQLLLHPREAARLLHLARVRLGGGHVAEGEDDGAEELRVLALLAQLDQRREALLVEHLLAELVCGRIGECDMRVTSVCGCAPSWWARLPRSVAAAATISVSGSLSCLMTKSMPSFSDKAGRASETAAMVALDDDVSQLSRQHCDTVRVSG